MTESDPIETARVSHQVRRLRWMLRLSVVVVAVVSIGGVVYLYRDLAKHSGESEALNLLARQRMLSQRLAKNVAVLALQAPDLDAAQVELRESMERLSRVQAALERGGRSFGFAGDLTAAEMEILARMRRHLDALLTIANAAIERRAGSDAGGSLSPGLRGHETAFVTDIDTLIKHLGDDRARAHRRHTRIASLLAIAIALTLALEWLLLYEPAIGLLVRRTRELVESEQRTRLVIDAGLDALVAMDAHGRVTDWNPQAERTFGFTHDEAVGRRLDEMIIPVGLREAHTAGVARFLDTGEARVVGRRIEVPAVRKDGIEITIELAVTPVRTPRGVWFSAFLRDITDRKRAEVQLAQAQKLESIGQLAAGIAHEINTPAQYVGDNVRFLKDTFGSLLAAIDAYDGALTGAGPQGPAGEDVRRRLAELDLAFLRDEIPKAIDQSLEGLGQVSSIVLAMKEFSHPGSADKTPADLNAAILSTITVCRNRWKYVARLETDLDRDLPRVPCLVAEFNQVVLNLVVNAADAIAERFGGGSADQGLIQVATRHAGPSVEITVSDNGGGVPPDIATRIFDPFFTTKGVGKGTGQGLAISRSVIVHKHGGTIDCVSEVGRGTKFVIQLPLETGVGHSPPGTVIERPG